MLPNKFEMPLDLALKPSRILLYCFYFLILLSLLSILLSTALPIIVRLALFSGVCFYAYALYSRLAVAEVTALSLKADNSWELRTHRGEQVTAELYGECIVTYFLLWLNFKTPGGEKYHLLLLRDSTGQEALRLLRARLRLR